MKYYTETISADLAEKLKEKGMPYIEIDCETYDSGTEYQRDERWCNNTYADVFDWLMDKNMNIRIHTYPARNPIAYGYILWTMDGMLVFDPNPCSELSLVCYPTWHEAANAAIEKALTLI